jgi:hypothetical protein
MKSQEARLLVAVDSETQGSSVVLTSCRVCGASAPATLVPVLPPPCVHALVPGIVPELCIPPPGLASQILQQQRSTQSNTSTPRTPWVVDPPCASVAAAAPAQAGGKGPLSYYDLCVLANRETLSSRPDGVPPRLLQHRSEASEWRGRRLCAAPPATVRQIDADLRRTTPHLWPIEAARVSWGAECKKMPPGALDASGPLAGLEVRSGFAPRASCGCRCALLSREADCRGLESRSAEGASQHASPPSCSCCDCTDSPLEQPWSSARAAGDLSARRDGLDLRRCPTGNKCQFSFATPTQEHASSLVSATPSRRGSHPSTARIVVSEAACRRVLLAFATHNPSVDYCQVRARFAWDFSRSFLLLPLMGGLRRASIFWWRTPCAGAANPMPLPC